MSIQNKIAAKEQQKVEDEISDKTTVTKRLVEDTLVVLRAPERVEPCCYDHSSVADFKKIDQRKILEVLYTFQ